MKSFKRLPELLMAYNFMAAISTMERKVMPYSVMGGLMSG